MMERTLRIVVADDEPRMREFLGKAVEHLGHNVVGSAATGGELIELCRSGEVDLVITDIKMPDRDGIDAAAEIYADRPIPVILVSAFHDEEFITRASQNHILAYLVKPIKDDQLKPAIALAMARFEEFVALHKEAEDSKQDRKLIERAKGILMKRAGLEEAAAFRRLQKHASGKRVRLVEIARTVIAAEETILDTP
jgi:response regulator NasT